MGLLALIKEIGTENKYTTLCVHFASVFKKYYCSTKHHNEYSTNVGYDLILLSGRRMGGFFSPSI
jgi:hypothetical protein